MKIMTVLGTRPEIIRLSLVIEKLDKKFDHILVHTGQNYTESLKDVFFKQLHVRTPDYSLDIRAGTVGQQIGSIIAETERLFLKEKPDKVLILGDTNSGLSAVPAKRLGIPVYHMEAGNRCYDDRVPEEVNRRIIDHASDVLMPYTNRSSMNLVREGIDRSRIYVIGNPIFEVLSHFNAEIGQSEALKRLGLEKRKYFLVTMHRAENVDIEKRLRDLVRALVALGRDFRIPVICSLHPRTKSRMQSLKLSTRNTYIQYLEPLGFFDFVALEKNALCVVSDSGTVQEECAIFGIPNVTIRDVTERPETIECGSNVLAGTSPGTIHRIVRTVLDNTGVWQPPEEYLENNVSQKVVNILTGLPPLKRYE